MKGGLVPAALRDAVTHVVGVNADRANYDALLALARKSTVTTDRVRYWTVALLWLAVNLAFWGWWLRHTAHSTPWLYWAETIAREEEITLGKNHAWSNRSNRSCTIAFSSHDAA